MAKQKTAVDHWQWNPVEGYYVAKPTFEKFEEVPAGYYQLGTVPYMNDVYCKPVALKEDRFIDFHDGPLSRVMEEVDRFWKSGDRYEYLGTAHKRSILLYGPPGTGKSMILVAVIRHVIELGGVAVQLDAPHQFGERLSVFRQVEEDRPVAVICEDVDALIKGADEKMCEILDGTGSLGQRMLYMSTTNNLNDVPERFRKRPSRIDTLIEIPVPSREQREEYVRALLGERFEEAYLEVAGENFSLADVKEGVTSVFVYGRTPDEAVRQLTGRDQPKSRKPRVLEQPFVNGYTISGNAHVAIAVNVKEPSDSKVFVEDALRQLTAVAKASEWASVQPGGKKHEQRDEPAAAG